MNRGPAFACKLITTWIITGRMKNRYANTAVGINCTTQTKTKTSKWLRKDGETSYIHIPFRLTVRMPHIWSKPHGWWAIGVILREGHDGVKESSFAALCSPKFLKPYICTKKLWQLRALKTRTEQIFFIHFSQKRIRSDVIYWKAIRSQQHKS